MKLSISSGRNPCGVRPNHDQLSPCVLAQECFAGHCADKCRQDLQCEQLRLTEAARMRPSNKIRAKATPSDCSTRASVWDAGSSLACLVVCCAGVTVGGGRRRFADAARRRCRHVIALGVADAPNRPCTLHAWVPGKNIVQVTVSWLSMARSPSSSSPLLLDAAGSCDAHRCNSEWRQADKCCLCHPENNVAAMSMTDAAGSQQHA
jgi:hypothetical protein